MSKARDDLSLACKRQCGYIKELEAEKAELVEFIKDLYFSELNDNDTTELTTSQVICLTTLYKKYNTGE